MYNIAVVGTGYISRKAHIPAWLGLRPMARIVALCDSDILRAQNAAAYFEVPAVFDNVERMLQEVKPDFVDVCTPPESHASVAISALEAGAHVLIEKPMSSSVEDCGAHHRGRASI